MINIREFLDTDANDAAAIWNKVIEDGVAFPQLEFLSAEEAKKFFKAQDFTGIALDSDSGEIVGLYILHPNNVGRCGHIAIKTNFVDRAMAYFKRMGFEFDESSITYDEKTGKPKFVYFKEEICGFAIHLLQK